MGFLILLFYVAAAVAVAVLVTRAVRGRGSSGGTVHDRYEAAFLNGGPARVVDTALASLHADGRITVGGPGIVAVVRPTAHDPVERAVFQAHAAAPHGALHHLRSVVTAHPAVQEIGDGLAARGLIVDPATRHTTIRWCGAVGLTAFLLFPVSIMITILDFVDRPDFRLPFVFAVLPALLAAGVTALVCGSTSSARVAPAGQGAAFDYGRAHGHLADAGTLVALHGLRALPDPALREQLLAAARVTGPRVTGPRGSRRGGRAGWGGSPVPGHRSSHGVDGAPGPVTVWCAGAGPWGGDGGGGNSCSSGSCSSGSCSSGSGCGGGSGGCGGSSSSCGGGSSSCGGSSSSSSCSSSSSSSCSSSSSS